jgi:putative acetyltransferase
LSGADSRDCIETYLQRNPGMSFVACSQDKIIGAILAGHDGRRGYIHHLAVHPRYRRLGIGRILVQHSLDALAKAGIQKCHLFLLNDNTGGLRFWQSAGWTFRKELNLVSKTIEIVDIL